MPDHKYSLEKMRLELVALRDNRRVIQSDAERHICNWLERFVETLQHGEPRTEQLRRHHE